MVFLWFVAVQIHHIVFSNCVLASFFCRNLDGVLEGDGDHDGVLEGDGDRDGVLEGDGDVMVTKSMPTWNHGEWTGMGCSSGLTVSSLRLLLWHWSHVEI